MFLPCPKDKNMKGCPFAFRYAGDVRLRCGQASGVHSPHSLVSDVKECDGRNPRYGRALKKGRVA